MNSSMLNRTTYIDNGVNSQGGSESELLYNQALVVLSHFIDVPSEYIFQEGSNTKAQSYESDTSSDMDSDYNGLDDSDYRDPDQV